MTDETEKPADTPEPGKEPLSPDDLVHMYGGFLYVAVPVALIALIVYLVMK